MSIRRLDEAIAASTRIADRLPPNARAEVSREAEASIVRRALSIR